MILQVSKITKDLEFSFNGSETWMGEIYQEFPLCNSKDHPLNIRLKIEILPEKRFKVTGSFSFSPLLECSRCAMPLTWPLEDNIDAVFEPEPTTFRKDSDLSSDDLDRYYYKDDQINLETFLNEVIQLSRPDQVLKKTADGSGCELCHKDIDDPLVFGSEEQKDNPFAVLKNLKLPH